MTQAAPVWRSPEALVAAERPDEPVFVLCPAEVAAGARRFLAGFPGLTTYAVKANPEPAVLMGLIQAGLRGFDVASPEEIRLVRRLCPEAALHYHNPVKSREELRFAHAQGVRAYAVDSRAELAKIAEVLPAEGVELSVRFRLPVKGAAYDFGAKFGATEAGAAALAREAADLGFRVSLTFHPGTQCRTPAPFVAYVEAAARIAAAAGVRPARLNVGGGFPGGRAEGAPPLETFFAAIEAAVAEAFGPDRPELVCEPGRGLVAGAMALVTRVKLIREDGAVFLNDGVYGGLAEAPLINCVPRARACDGAGAARAGAGLPRVIFGPTCDSVDMLPGETALPADLAEEDFVIFEGLGAYGTATCTRFNGFGPQRVELAETLASPAPLAAAA
jgi:ornithine decarboxylase